MLNYNAKGSYTDRNGVPWIYYQDDVKTNIFYIVPAPSWVLDADGNPEIKVVQYTTDQNSGSGYVIFNTQLTAPNDVAAGVQNAIATQFPAAPKPYQLNPLDYNPGCTASFTLDVKGTRQIIRRRLPNSAPTSPLFAPISTKMAWRPLKACCRRLAGVCKSPTI
jgi:hypothetical protein